MDKINKQLKYIEKHLGKNNNVYLYLLHLTYINDLGEKINCIKIGHTTRKPIERFSEIYNNFNLMDMKIIFLLNIDNPNIYERYFHSMYKQFRLKDINSSVFSKSKECYPYDEKMIENIYNFYILKLNKVLKKNNYYINKKLDFIEKINKYISGIKSMNLSVTKKLFSNTYAKENTELESYAKEIYTKKILESCDLCINVLQKLNIRDNIAIYFEDVNKWYKGHIIEVNKRRTRKENVSVEIKFSKDKVLRYNILANNANYGRDKEWVLPIK